MHRATPAHSSFRAFSAGGARATVNSVDDSKFMQEHASDFMAGESRKGIESPQNYGFTSVCAPPTKDEMGNIIACAETFIHFMGGNRSFPVGGNMDDRRHRLLGLNPGDVAMFRQALDKLQFHLNDLGGFLTAPRDKTLRMHLLDEDTQQQQQGGQSGGGGSGGTRAADGGGGSSGGAQGGKQKAKMGQQAVYKDAQKSFRYVDVTKDETRASGTNVRSYLADGKAYLDVNEDKNVYLGAQKGKGTFAMLVTVKGPVVNGQGKIK
jgi:Bacteriophage Mu Gp45 spike protein